MDKATHTQQLNYIRARRIEFEEWLALMKGQDEGIPSVIAEGEKEHAILKGLEETLVRPSMDNVLATLIQWTSLGYKVSMEKIGYEQYQITMSKDGEDRSQVLPEDHLQKDIHEVMQFIHEKFKEKEVANG